MLKPKIIKGGSFKDHRGQLLFVNDFDFKGVVRFYLIKHNDVSFIRAWQGHKVEKKYFYVIKGSFVVAWVKIDNFKNPSVKLKAEYKILSSGKSEVLFIPEGYANGLKSMEPDSEIMVFSNLTLEESKDDDYRFQSDWWFNWDLIAR